MFSSFSTLILIAASIVHASNPPPSCPTTLIVQNGPQLNGCTSTKYGHTSTSSVDCGGCSSLVTSTTYNRFFGHGPACVNYPIPTTTKASATTTVTSCEVTPTKY
ncbi:unnamed protein product [Zymoseptoria tritici ST99CH_1E4]|uniref:Uncharacterized protein n=1 Tax=Zymoseptoria tritici ST99CH_1E4 TaxID=1276532 RepID=A0A2H1GY62_ZYMTR|nr:unnamed protein product [Zymoseptoria tritici ST99CH_1E4]